VSKLDRGRDILRATYGKRRPSAPSEAQSPHSPHPSNRSAAIQPDDALPPELRALMGDEASPQRPGKATRASGVVANANWKPEPQILETPTQAPSVRDDLQGAGDAATDGQASTVAAPPSEASLRRPPAPSRAAPVERTWRADEPVRAQPGTPASRYDWSNHGGS
jgi:hypothetical protein